MIKNLNKKVLKISIFIIITIICVAYYIKDTNNENILNENIFLNNLTTENIFTNNSSPNSNNELLLESAENNLIKIKVHIIGEVNSPGLYELEEGARIYDLILIAGNTTQNADLNKVNLAYQLSDGEKIYIPSIFDDNSTYIYNDAGVNVISSSNIKTTTNSSNSAGKIGKININKASLEELETISGIGSSLAQKIIEYRNSNGKFSSLEDLKNVSGIGEKKYNSIKEKITLN